MTKIFDATLDIFIYHLKEGLGENTPGICKKYDDFWSGLPEKVKEYFPIAKIETLNTNYLKFHYPINSYTINAFYQRKTIDDSDILWYSKSVYDIDTDILAVLPLVKNLSFEKDKIDETGYLGETWMITGWLNEIVDDDTKLSLAEKAYEILLNKKPAYWKKGEFLGATIFEFWCATEYQWDGIEKDSHVVIIFYRNEDDFRESAKLYNDWRYLFYCRHKIIWAYEQAKELRSSLLKDYSNSSPKVSELSQQDLNQLKEKLQENIDTLARYVENLSHLETQKYTLQVNLRNYKKICEQEDFKDVNILKEFSEIAINKYQTQIEEDRASLRPGLSIRENLTATIRGMVEIKQAESDRLFQETVEQWGIGIGIAAIAATSISPFIPNITKNKLTEPFPAVEGVINLSLTFFISIIIGIAAKNKARKLIKSRRPPS